MQLPGSRSSVISGLYDSVLTLIYPHACAVCSASVESRHDGASCRQCWDATQLFGASDALCWKCGAFTAVMVTAEKRMMIRCGQCDDDNFTAARACGFYEGALRASVLALKRDSHVPRRIIETLLKAQQREPIIDSDLIIPVPLHAKRERERGHNQAAVLARELAKAAKLELDEHSLVRRVHTEKHRAGMDSRARRESVTGAFEVRRPKLIADRRVLLIDDVFTTGATVSECAAVLNAAGARAVYVLTIARA